MAKLLFDDVSIERGGRLVVRGFSAALHSGEALKVHGLNGSGKTTLLRATAGLISPVAGRISWEGAPLAQHWRKGGGRIAWVGHQDGVKAGLTVRENMAFWARLFGGERVAEAIGLLRLDGLLDRPARQLSAGQRRRLALSRLFLGEWDLWLLDEPMTALDPPARSRFGEGLRRHLRGGGMAVISSHDELDFPGPRQSLDGAPS